MRVIVTGANGLLGKALIARLCGPCNSLPGGIATIDRIVAQDLSFDRPPVCAKVSHRPGDIGDRKVVNSLFDTPVDLVFHLASIPGGMAEQDPVLGRRINVDATIALLETAGAQARPPVFVFASSIAVLGAPLPVEGVDDRTPFAPKLSYGAHKWIGEILVADASRRGKVDGRSIRFPGIVARPPQATGQLSRFMSEVIREPAAGRPYRCPVAASSTVWLTSTACSVDNLLHAAVLDSALLGDSRACTLPSLVMSMAELVDAVGRAYSVDATSLVTFGSDPALEANFGRQPPLSTPHAERAGFCHDGDAITLVKRALQD